ncbi:hypothetical protein ES703_42658 [subsurface metagenome]
MAFEREKPVKGHVYHYLLENYRQDGRVRQRILQYWGRADESSVHKAYRDNIGPVTPIIAEELSRAERQWPDWIMAAIREAVVYDKLSLAYILGVLEAWQERGGPDRKAPSALSPSSSPSQPAARQSITLAEWFKLWSDEYLKDATVGTQSFYNQTFVTHILPALGDIPLQELTRSWVRRMLDTVPNNSQGFPGRNRIRGALQDCLVGAMDKGLLNTNPASRFEYVDSVCKWCGRTFRAQKRYDGGPPIDHCNRNECVDKNREEWRIRRAEDGDRHG